MRRDCTHVTVTCPNEDCEREIQVTYHFGFPPRIGGRVEDSDPGESGEMEPDTCPHCGTELDYDSVSEAAAEHWRDMEAYAADCRYDQWKEDQLLNRRG